MKQFTLLGMISRIGPDNILHRHGLNVLKSTTPKKLSWFYQVRSLSEQYGLPDPVNLLETPLTKQSFKSLVKNKILDWWQKKLRAEAAPLSSLYLLNTNFMSLARTHPIWTSAGNSPYEVEKAKVQARMLSGRYRANGFCQIPGCSDTSGTLLYIATGQWLKPEKRLLTPGIIS